MIGCDAVVSSIPVISRLAHLILCDHGGGVVDGDYDDRHRFGVITHDLAFWHDQEVLKSPCGYPLQGVGLKCFEGYSPLFG